MKGRTRVPVPHGTSSLIRDLVPVGALPVSSTFTNVVPSVPQALRMVQARVFDLWAAGLQGLASDV